MRSRIVVMCAVALSAFAGVTALESRHAVPARAESVPVGLDPAAFTDPPKDSRPTVLWFWNGTITNELIDSQLADLRARGVYEAVVFPFDTPNLEPAFFSEGWFDVVEHTLREAQRTGMHLWLFNDDFFPSGRAAGLIVNGGTVGDRAYQPHPELRPRGLAKSTRTVTGPGPVVLDQSPTGLSVVDGRLVVDAAAMHGPAVLGDGLGWTDYTVTTHAVIDTGTAGLLVRAKDPDNGYLVDTRADGGVDIWRQVAGTFTLLNHGDPAAGFDPAAQHEISVTLSGATITPAIDGVARTGVTDATFPAGTVGFRAVATQRSRYDDLTITGSDGSALYAQTFTDDSALNDFVSSGEAEVVAASARPDDSKDASRVVDLTDYVQNKRPWQAPPGRWTVDTFTASPLADTSPGSFRRWYLDLLDTGAVGRMLDAVPGEYYRRFGWAFGTVVKGFWDDEPFIASANAHFNIPPWSPSMPGALAKLGTSPGIALSSTFTELGRNGRIQRGDYWRAVSNRFADAYYKQQADWMAAHHVQLISNPLWDEYGPAEQVKSTGNLTTENQWAQVPGTDAVFDHYAPGGRTMLPRYAASEAHQTGAGRVLLENFGGMGWGIDPEFMRALIGAFAVRGINLDVYHAMWTDTNNIVYAPPFQSINPWWQAAKPITDWTGRVMQVGRGRPVAPTALIKPQRAAEQWQDTPEKNTIDTAFTDANTALEDSQVDFDLLDEGALSADPEVRVPASVVTGQLKVGPQSYRVAVLPQTPTIDLATVDTLTRFVRSGGTLVAVGDLPTEEAGGRDVALRTALSALFAQTGNGRAVRAASPAELGAAVRSTGAAAAVLSPASSAVRVLRLRTGGDWAFMVVNESGQPVDTDATFPVYGTPERWDPRTGSTAVASVFDADVRSGVTTLPLRLDPYETQVVAFRQAQLRPEQIPHLVQGTGLTRAMVDSTGQLSGELLAMASGKQQLVGLDGNEVFSGEVTVADPLSPVALDGDWSFQFDRPGSTADARPLGSWTTTDPTFSGSATYRRSIDLDAATLAGRRWTLDLGSAGSVADVTVNGHAYAPVDWQPYTLDVTDALHPGANDIVVRVSNTLANAHGEAKVSGLLGPVRLLPSRWVPFNLPAAGTDGALVVHAPATAAVAPGQTVQIPIPVRLYGGHATSVPVAASADGLTVSATPNPLRLDQNGRGVVTLSVTAPPDAATPSSGAIHLVIGTSRADIAVTVLPATRLGSATASSSYPSHAVGTVNDGITSSDGWDSGQGWNDNTIDQFPDSVQITFGAPAPIAGLDVNTLDSAKYSAASFGTRDLDAQVLVDGQWRTVATIRGMTTGEWHPRFAAATSTAVRVVVLASNDEHYSRLIEIQSVAR